MIYIYLTNNYVSSYIPVIEDWLIKLLFIDVSAGHDDCLGLINFSLFQNIIYYT